MWKSGKTEDLWKKQREGRGAGLGYREKPPNPCQRKEWLPLTLHAALLYLGFLGSLPR